MIATDEDEDADKDGGHYYSSLYHFLFDIDDAPAGKEIVRAEWEHQRAREWRQRVIESDLERETRPTPHTHTPETHTTETHTPETHTRRTDRGHGP
jgi:hypothetical protein